jgi:hypothetical protein
MSAKSICIAGHHIGERVRVTGKPPSDQTNVAVIACVNLDGTYDIIYDTKTKNEPDEDHNVLGSRISALEPFELSSGSFTSPLELKNQGNILFQKCKDINAATSFYNNALDDLLRGVELSVGSTVLVELTECSFRTGMVSDVDDENHTVEVMYDISSLYDDDEEEEEAIVPKKRISLVAKDIDVTIPAFILGDNHSTKRTAESKEELSSSREQTTSLGLQRALYMNLARCCMKRVPPRPGWAVRWASLAIALSQLEAAAAEEASAERRVRGFGCNSRPASDPLQRSSRCVGFPSLLRPCPLFTYP